MTASVRLKLRCMTVSHDWQGASTATFRPVHKDTPENRIFWEATPAGEATLCYKGELPYKPGAFYFVDMKESDEGDWKLRSVARHDSNQMDATFSFPWRTGEGMFMGDMEFRIDNPAAHHHFERVGSCWEVEFAPAPEE